MPTRGEWCTQRMFDDAVDFAHLHQHIPFCRKMVLVFRAKGRLTDGQALALLRIKAGFRRSAS